MNTQPEALLKAVTQAFGPDGEATQFDAETWGRIHAAITSTLALNQELLRSLSWIDQRCPAVLLLQDVHRIHQEAAFDAGACARAAIAKAESAHGIKGDT